MDWGGLFAPQILERGYDYFEEGLVEGFKKTKTKITAKVWGSEEYDVSIKIKNDTVVGAECDCPYAVDGKYCKHMAAVLYFNEEHQQEDDPSVNELVSKASEKDVRDFLTKVLKNDTRLRTLFQSLVEPDNGDLKSYQQSVDAIIAEYADPSGFIDYYRADRFESDMYHFIVDGVQLLIEDEDLKLAFSVINYVVKKLNYLDIDDSSGCIMRLAEECEYVWEQVIDQADLTFKKKMFAWFQENYDILSVFTDTFDSILSSNFDEKEFLKKKLVWSDKKFHDSQENGHSDYDASKWGVYHVQIMKKLNLPDDEIEEFCLDNDNYSDIRNLYIDSCIAKKDYQAAIDSLIKGKEQSKRLPGVMEKFSIKLKDIYKNQHRTEDYLNEMWEILTKYYSINIDIYREYKQQFSDDEWVKQREKLFSKVQNGQDLERLYIEEGLYDRLLKLVLGESGLHGVKLYEQRLKKRYPKQVLHKYETEIQIMASHAGSRGHYREIVRTLNHMATLTNGYEAAVEMISEWKTKYANRPAMMDELRGFDQRIY